jgi:redox-sensitive bicupin YhaK (pirin superfamily)
MLANSPPVTRPTKGVPHSVGKHFDAHSFSQNQYGVAIDPLLMVDHFRMTKPTFGPHRHAGFSAVTYVFEDSRSPHLNSDSLGNDLAIHPGALHWMVAGRGVEHDEWPGGENPEVHGLQFFVNLPADKRNIDPYAVHLEPNDVPEYRAAGVRIRVVAGKLDEFRSPVQLPQPFSIFDAFLDSGACTNLPAQAGWGAWLYVLDGSIQIKVDDESVVLEKGFSVAMGEFGDASALQVTSLEKSQFIMMSGEPVGR